MLCGPDAFWKKAKDILPWNDDDSDAECIKGMVTQTASVQNVPSTISRCAAVYDENPFGPLPKNWEIGPLSMGVSIAVKSPSTVANKILKHCKDMGSHLLTLLTEHFE